MKGSEGDVDVDTKKQTEAKGRETANRHEEEKRELGPENVIRCVST